ncbi:unnamed protein product [Spirodela intermedia]|uniref:DUF642 domain-containing protein n=1 Tax=Spirodela intermedia TaxID=51605 RepID=A0A7I8IU70_SPIIN|nr:unnamed protein product [Spirodela intermedia]CAA6661367.1 unnamed protein product [Spirodela intermedia]
MWGPCVSHCLPAALRCLLNNGDFETPPPRGFPVFNNIGGVVGDTTVPGWTTNGTVELVESGQKQGGMILIVPKVLFNSMLGNDAQVQQEWGLWRAGPPMPSPFCAARTCAMLESLNVSATPSAVTAASTVDLQTVYSVEGWDAYAWAFQANPGMEDDPSCGPVIDNIAIKKLFEGPWMFPNATLGVLFPTNFAEETSALPGWIVESDRAVRYIDSYHFSVPQGKRAVELLSGKEGIISQMVETTPGKQYSLSFALGSAGDSCQLPMAVMAFAGDQAQNVHYSPTGNLTYQSSSLNFTATAERSRVAFYSVYYNTRSDDRSSLCGPVVDDVRVLSLSGGATSSGRPVSVQLLVALALLVASI